MSVHVAEKKGNALKGSNGLIATIENEDGDWQSGQNLLMVTQETQGKEMIGMTDNQTINLAIDTYCSYISRIFLLFRSRSRRISRDRTVEFQERKGESERKMLVWLCG